MPPPRSSIRRRTTVGLRLRVCLISVFAATAVMGALVVAVITGWIFESAAGRMPQGGELVREVPQLVQRQLWITLAVLVPAFVAVGAAVTARIAGPIERLAQHLDAIASGARPESCQFAEDDELFELGVLLDRAVERIANEAEPEPQTVRMDDDDVPSIVRSRRETEPAQPA